MEIDNIQKIRSFMKFEDPDEFYFISLIQRKKDGNNTISSHDGARRIRSFCIFSLEEFDKVVPFMKMICIALNARAYIDLRRKNNKTIQLDLITILVDNYKCNSKKTRGLFESAVDKSKSRDKLWMIDLDSQEDGDYNATMQYLTSDCNADVVYTLETVNGYHLITSKFDRRKFIENDIRSLKTSALTLMYYNDSNKNILEV